MDSDTIIEVEDYIFKIIKKEARAASMMASVIGVLCDVKPTMATNFNEDELKDLDLSKFTELFDKLGLKVLFCDRFYCSRGKTEFIKDCYISRDMKLARKIHESFNELWSTMDDVGRIVEMKKWRVVTEEIGKLLGYPKTAVDSFIDGRDLENKDRIKIMKRNRYYAHSVEYEEDEYNQFDRKINITISKYAPKTTNFMINEKEKRWL